jgi:hypothetical protein
MRNTYVLEHKIWEFVMNQIRTWIVAQWQTRIIQTLSIERTIKNHMRWWMEMRVSYFQQNNGRYGNYKWRVIDWLIDYLYIFWLILILINTYINIEIINNYLFNIDIE